jgi:hypothetical protein
MCVSLRMSIISSITSLISASILYYFSKETVYKRLALFFLFVSLMQWYDIIFWLNQTPNTTNYVFTKIAMISNHLQPIVLAYVLSSEIKLNTITQILLYTYMIYAFFYSIVCFQNIQYTLVTPRTSPVLDWEWNFIHGYMIMYVLFFVLDACILFHLPYPLNYIMITIQISSFVFSKYITRFFSVVHTAGKLWCVLASYIPIILLFIQKYI